ncbi:MAG: molecular chaperone TorD [Pseudooceanicola sp.]|jgi:TorA maturation chaperone TorD|nr:molecular chaperone TorD [Pseudooceanicola sp.]
MSNAAVQTAIPEEDRMRADLYDFLARLLAAPPDAQLLRQTASLTGDDSELGRAIASLAKVAAVTRETAAAREFNALFIGLGRGELLPYASYYLTGFLNEKPLARLRSDMAARAMTRAENTYEPEDNIASLFEMMGGMITGRFGTPADLADQRLFWSRHIGPWAAHFMSDLEAAESSVFYAGVGQVGRVFLGIEKEGFRLTTA